MKGNFSVSIRNIESGNEWEVADGLHSKDEALRAGERYIHNFILTGAQDRYAPVVYKITKEEVHGSYLDRAERELRALRPELFKD